MENIAEDRILGFYIFGKLSSAYIFSILWILSSDSGLYLLIFSQFYHKFHSSTLLSYKYSSTNSTTNVLSDENKYLCLNSKKLKYKARHILYHIIGSKCLQNPSIQGHTNVCSQNKGLSLKKPLNILQTCLIKLEIDVLNSRSIRD